MINNWIRDGNLELKGEMMNELDGFVDNKISDKLIRKVVNSEIAKKVRKEFASVRPKILKRDNYTCQKCYFQSLNGGMEVHHIKLIVYGGTNDYDNLITLCEPCHSLAPEDPDSFRNYLAFHFPNNAKLLLQMVKFILSKEDKITNEYLMEDKLDNEIFDTYKTLREERNNLQRTGKFKLGSIAGE